MKYATPTQRILSFVLDFIILITIVFVIGRLFWSILPETELKGGSMLRYRESDFRNFFITAGLSTILILIYHLLLPSVWMRATIGQRIFQVYMGRPDGTTLTKSNAGRRFLLILAKSALIFCVGPILAILGANFAANWIGLVLPAFIFITLSVKAWTSPEGAWIVENFGQYRYFSGQIGQQDRANQFDS